VVLERSELIFLGRFQPPAQVSFYAVPFAMTERVIDLLPGAILSALLPGLAYAQAATDPERFRAVFRQALRYLGGITLPICLLGIPLAPFLIGLLYGPRFEPAAVVLQILLVSVVFGVVGQAARSALLAMESQAFLVKTGAIAAATSIALDLILIPRWGAVGAAIANTTVQVGWAVAIFLPLWRRLRLTRPMPVAEAVASS
jgi:O-antigen/teichoic acid export membrane protein